jgi:hypothetical protein
MRLRRAFRLEENRQLSSGSLVNSECGLVYELLALERPRQLLALRVLAPHGEVDDGPAVLEEPSANVRHPLPPSTRPRAVGTAAGSRLEHLEERVAPHEHAPADVERRDLAAGDRVVRARPGDARTDATAGGRTCIGMSSAANEQPAQLSRACRLACSDPCRDDVRGVAKQSR